MNGPRLQMRLSDQQKELVSELQEICDLKTQTDVIENALMLFAWVVSQYGKGLTLASVDDENGRYNEVHLPALEAARRHHERTSRKLAEIA